MKSCAIIVAIILTGAISSGELLHDGVSHHHGESAIWQQLHTALRHDEKKNIVVQNASLIFFVLKVFLISSLTFISICYLILSISLDPILWALRRGIFRYRRFT